MAKSIKVLSDPVFELKKTGRAAFDALQGLEAHMDEVAVINLDDPSHPVVFGLTRDDALNNAALAWSKVTMYLRAVGDDTRGTESLTIFGEPR